MPIYAPLTDIIGTPATGVVVPSAWGDQVDANCLHHYQGTWFRAIGGATSLANNAFTVIPMTSIVISQTATDETSALLVANVVTVRRVGLWHISACVNFASTTTSGILISATDSTNTYATEAFIDTTGSHPAHAASAIINVTTNPATFNVSAYQSSGAAFNLTVTNFSPRLSGVWLGEHP
jgi:hypothetical protein